MVSEHYVACTLTASGRAARIAWIGLLNATALDTYQRDGRRIRLKYRPTAAAQARELVRHERECCPSLQFSIEEDDDAVVVIIDAPADFGADADDLFAPRTRPRGQP
ncbi:hypothetical protein MMARJ_28430 [Mycobacterium marseillense]|uniref:Uncharacterized protein n=1 Tax=Mycobacterium marseillense TaxID=701042 RepID=A0ABM7JDY8_9MYCO|nr:hypothetical protein [Mycobacterium marseillense]MCV7403771.1 hypothetical protein [Mycobacterium marseillense]ORA93182.1 hypothetical protein BST31_12555 [Mycobacterium marseillense]BBY12103.1 hypothetical protein MMARJ_28430 [Mycobacterium marseillense]